MSTMTLQAIVDADTTEARTDKGDHGYLPLYEELFSQFRDTTNSILEIGVGMGGSLKVWERWFPYAEIHGIDVRPLYERLGPRITTHEGHTLDRAFLNSIGIAFGPFALVIDDGGHVGDEQEVSFRTLWPHLAEGGMYVVEDLHASYIPEYQPSGMPFLKSLIDSVNQHGDFADVVAVQFYPKLCVIAKRSGPLS